MRSSKEKIHKLMTGKPMSGSSGTPSTPVTATSRG
jgi:hypothetical protein